MARAIAHGWLECPAGRAFPLLHCPQVERCSTALCGPASPVFINKKCVRVGGSCFCLGHKPSLSRDLLQLGSRVAPHRHHGQSIGFFDASHHRQHGFHRHGAGLDEVSLHQRQDTCERSGAPFPIIIQRCSRHLRHLARNFIGSDRDEAYCLRAQSRAGSSHHRRRKPKSHSGTALQISAICVMLPLASLTPAIFGISASRATLPASIFAAVRPGTL